MYIGWYIPGYIASLVPWWVYSLPYHASLLYLPGYTPVYTSPTYHWVHCSTSGYVRASMTLGSERENGLGESLSGP